MFFASRFASTNFLEEAVSSADAPLKYLLHHGSIVFGAIADCFTGTLAGSAPVRCDEEWSLCSRDEDAPGQTVWY